MSSLRKLLRKQLRQFKRARAAARRRREWIYFDLSEYVGGPLDGLKGSFLTGLAAGYHRGEDNRLHYKRPRPSWMADL